MWELVTCLAAPSPAVPVRALLLAAGPPVVAGKPGRCPWCGRYRPVPG
jgi:hypothetical protein